MQDQPPSSPGHALVGTVLTQAGADKVNSSVNLYDTFVCLLAYPAAAGNSSHGLYS